MTTLLATPTVADALEQTLEWLDQCGCAERSDDRREVRRSRYRVKARIGVEPPGQIGRRIFDVTTRNLSRSGLSFVHRTLLYPGQNLLIYLPLPDKSVQHIRATVVHVRTAGINLYEIGVRFTDVEISVAHDN